MKLFLSLTFLVLSLPALAEWKTVTTDLEKDCLVISSATDQAPIDFYQAECKSFGGYSLFIEGMDLRYGPQLFFGNNEIELKRPMSFHDLSGNEVKWHYTLEVDGEGSGKLEWKGIVYPMSFASEDGEKENVRYYAVALRGKKSCVIDIALSEKEAVETLRSENAPCLP